MGTFIEQLLAQGYNCAQIMALSVLDRQGKACPELVRALSGLGGGLGCGKLCGALSGAVCAMGLCAENAEARLQEATKELIAWFEEVYGPTECTALRAMNGGVCKDLIVNTCTKMTELLEDYALL